MLDNIHAMSIEKGETLTSGIIFFPKGFEVDQAVGCLSDICPFAQDDLVFPGGYSHLVAIKELDSVGSAVGKNWRGKRITDTEGPSRLGANQFIRARFAAIDPGVSLCNDVLTRAEDLAMVQLTK